MSEGLRRGRGLKRTLDLSRIFYCRMRLAGGLHAAAIFISHSSYPCELRPCLLEQLHKLRLLPRSRLQLLPRRAELALFRRSLCCHRRPRRLSMDSGKLPAQALALGRGMC